MNLSAHLYLFGVILATAPTTTTTTHSTDATTIISSINSTSSVNPTQSNTLPTKPIGKYSFY